MQGRGVLLPAVARVNTPRILLAGLALILIIAVVLVVDMWRTKRKRDKRSGKSAHSHLTRAAEDYTHGG
jgi:hypothetical protein